MGRIWNRNKDPHTAEELMIAEYQRNLKELKDMQVEYDTLVAMQDFREENYQKAASKLLSEIDALKDRIDAIEKQSTGIIDLHKEVPIFYIAMWDEWDMRHYFSDESDRIQQLKRWANFPKTRLIRDTQKERFSSHTQILSIKESTAELLSIPTPDGGHKQMLLDVRHTDTLIDVNAEFTCGRWIPGTVDTITEKAYENLKQRMQNAAHYLEKEAKENDE